MRLIYKMKPLFKKAQLITDFQLNNHILFGSVMKIIILQPVNNLSEIKKIATKKS